METYRNMEGALGVVHFTCDEESITVMLHSGVVFFFTYANSGKDNVEHMKKLARSGNGLNNFIFEEMKENPRGKE